MDINLEQLKAIELVTFCERCYGMQFQRKGHVFVSLSPFRQEQNPSFVIHNHNGQWLFKDFSSGKGGSIIDLVRELEDLPEELSAIAARIEALLKQHPMALESEPAPVTSTASASAEVRTDLSKVFNKIQENSTEPSRDYLEKRDIPEKVINDLMQRQQLFTNVYNGKTYCCFAVHDPGGRLMCLDNHQIDGRDKFVLGEKHVFVPDYQALAGAEEVTITEGIIDLLSMQTLFSSVGLALLGTALDFPAEWIDSSKKLVLALDNDDAGDLGKKKIRARFPEKMFEDFSVGDYKDPNEVLMAIPDITTKRKKYSPKQKVRVYKEYQRCQNKSAVSRKFGIDRSYLSEIIAESDEVIETHFGLKRPGRKKADEPKDMAQALEQIKTLKAQNLDLAKAKEEFYISNEFLKLQLSWANSQSSLAQKKKRHLKKRKTRDDKHPGPFNPGGHLYH